MWEDFHAEPFTFQNWPENIVLRHEGQAKALPETFPKPLELGKKMILIDTKGVFILSHDPWFLPPYWFKKKLWIYACACTNSENR